MSRKQAAGEFRSLGRICFSWMIPGVEHWLEALAAEGWQLYNVDNVFYYFHRGEPRRCRYYIAISELGSNSEEDAVQELRGMGAEMFGSGTHHFGGPDSVLCLELPQDPQRLERLYRERNRRCIGSMLNMMGAFGVFALCLTAYFGLYAKDMAALFFSDLFLLLLAAVFGGFLWRFVAQCRKYGQPYRSRKSQR